MIKPTRIRQPLKYVIYDASRHKEFAHLYKIICGEDIDEPASFADGTKNWFGSAYITSAHREVLENAPYEVTVQEKMPINAEEVTRMSKLPDPIKFDGRVIQTTKGNALLLEFPAFYKADDGKWTRIKDKVTIKALKDLKARQKEKAHVRNRNN